FYPFIGGFRGGPPGLDFLFLFEPAEKYKPGAFPRDWLTVASSAASFGRERVDFYPAVSDPEGPAWTHAVHQRLRHERGYTVCQRLELLKWYVGQANRLLYELADVANFTEDQKPDGLIDPVFAFEHHLTVDRILRQTLLA